MAEKKSKKIGATIYVKLVDTGSIFHDPAQRKDVTGKRAVAMQKTTKVALALRNNVIKEVTKSEADKMNATHKASISKAANEGATKKEKELVAANKKLVKAADDKSNEAASLAKELEELKAVHESQAKELEELKKAN